MDAESGQLKMKVRVKFLVHLVKPKGVQTKQQ